MNEVYVLRYTDGYDSNTVVMVSAGAPDPCIEYMGDHPPDHVDYYILDRWVDGEIVNSETWNFAAWEARTPA